MPRRNRSVRKSFRRFTPYSKTPVKRFLAVGKPDHGVFSQSISTSSIPSISLSELVNVSWKVYQASPLYQYSLRRQTIKNLAQALQKTLQTPVLDVNSDIKRKVRFRIVDGLKLNSEDPEALMMTLYEHTEGSSSGTAVFNCVLCVVREDTSNSLRLPNNFVHVPVILMRGSVLLSYKVKSCLEDIFDCHIQKFKFAPKELTWMFAMWSGFVVDPKKKVKLLYSPPEEVKGIRRISYEIDATDCQNLWQSLHGTNRKEIFSSEVNAFTRCLRGHFYQHFKVNLAVCRLLEIRTSIINAANDGRIKIISEEAVLPCLKHVTTLLLEL